MPVFYPGVVKAYPDIVLQYGIISKRVEVIYKNKQLRWAWFANLLFFLPQTHADTRKQFEFFAWATRLRQRLRRGRHCPGKSCMPFRQTHL